MYVEILVNNLFHFQKIKSGDHVFRCIIIDQSLFIIDALMNPAGSDGTSAFSDTNVGLAHILRISEEKSPPVLALIVLNAIVENLPIRSFHSSVMRNVVFP